MFKFLGKGGSGRVYQSGEGKVTKIGDIGPEEITCQQEAADLGISPGVVDSTDNSITMDHIDGQTLWEQDELTEEQYRVLETKVGKAHKRRLFHNDLVASNIMIDNSGEPHLIDWGCGSTTWPDPSRKDDEDQLKKLKKRYVR